MGTGSQVNKIMQNRCYKTHRRPTTFVATSLKEFKLLIPGNIPALQKLMRLLSQWIEEYGMSLPRVHAL